MALPTYTYAGQVSNVAAKQIIRVPDTLLPIDFTNMSASYGINVYSVLLDIAGNVSLSVPSQVVVNFDQSQPIQPAAGGTLNAPQLGNLTGLINLSNVGDASPVTTDMKISDIMRLAPNATGVNFMLFISATQNGAPVNVIRTIPFSFLLQDPNAIVAQTFDTALLEGFDSDRNGAPGTLQVQYVVQPNGAGTPFSRARPYTIDTVAPRIVIADEPDEAHND